MRIGPTRIEIDDVWVDVPRLVCACGSDDAFAVAPGFEAPRQLEMFATERSVAQQCWCFRCWIARFAAEILQNNRQNQCDFICAGNNEPYSGGPGRRLRRHDPGPDHGATGGHNNG